MCSYMHRSVNIMHYIKHAKKKKKIVNESCTCLEKGYSDFQKVLLILLRDQRDRKNAIRSLSQGVIGGSMGGA